MPLLLMMVDADRLTCSEDGRVVNQYGVALALDRRDCLVGVGFETL